MTMDKNGCHFMPLVYFNCLLDFQDVNTSVQTDWVKDGSELECDYILGVVISFGVALGQLILYLP